MITLQEWLQLVRVLNSDAASQVQMLQVRYRNAQLSEISQPEPLFTADLQR
jgi:hypothetical protein